MIKKGVATLVIIFAVLSLFPETLMALTVEIGTYARGKIILSDGQIIEGKNVQMKQEEVSIDVGSLTNTYQLSDVQQIMVKRGGLAPKWAAACGGAFALTAFLETAMGDYEVSEQYFVGTLFVSALFAGGGYLIGHSLDKWRIVYSAPDHSHQPQQLHLDLDSTKSGAILLAFKYRF